MRLQVRLLTTLLAALSAVVLLAGCGGGGGGSDLTASQVLDKTFGSDAAVKSGVLTLTAQAELPGQTTNGPVRVRLNGPFQGEGADALPKFDFDLSLDLNGQSVNAGAVSTSDAAWLRFMGQAYSVPDQLFSEFEQSYLAERKRTDAKQQGGSLQALGVDPRDWLRDPKIAGDEEVGGVKTTHVTAGVDVPKMLADLRSALQATGQASQVSPKEQRQLEQSVKSAKIDVWSGQDDHLLRKLAVNVDLGQGSLALTLQLDELNEDQTINAPSGAKPLNDLLSLFGAGASAITGGSGSTGSTGGGGASSQQQKYLQCVQSAGGDVAKMQDCAKLLH